MVKMLVFVYMVGAVAPKIGIKEREVNNILGFGGGYTDPNSGDYWWWDDEEISQPFVEPLVGIPHIYAWQDITSETPLAPYNNRCAVKNMPDSFWYYGVWYTEEDKLCISPDGWISFDNAEAGAPYPPFSLPDPSFPNAVIAPFWTPLNPTQPQNNTKDNRIYYKYDALNRVIIIEWYKVQRDGNPQDWFTFEVLLKCGGKRMLANSGYAPEYSLHGIDFMYKSHGGIDWSGVSPAVTGIENHYGLKGVTIPKERIEDGRAIRLMYRRVFRHDVSAEYILSPGRMVLRWTPIQPVVVVGNKGREVEHFVVTLNIYREKDSALVYHETREIYNLPPYDPTDPSQSWRENVKFPCWVPEEMGEKYTAEVSVDLATDEYECNDICARGVEVRCEDTLSYPWRMDVFIAWGFTHADVLTGYPMEGGGIITGGAAYSPMASTGPWGPVIWEDICDDIKPPTLEKRIFVGEPVYGTGIGWNEWSVKPGVWADCNPPCLVYAGVYSPGAQKAYVSFSPVLRFFSNPPCIPDPTYTLLIWDHQTGTWSWGSREYFAYLIQRLYVHLVFGDFPLSPHPSPPCYYDNAHDLKVYDIINPSKEYVEAGVSITPEIAIANIGRQREPDEGYFYVIFQAVNAETGKIHKLDSTAVDHIGYLGDPTDDPDTLYVPISSWTPEGQCVSSGEGVEYEIAGIVRLPEVGPPGKPKADHCINNDTLKRTVTALLSHDVGVSEIIKPTDRWSWDPGDIVELSCVVENFGFHDEANIEIYCEISDCGPENVSPTDPDTLVYVNVKIIDALSWRGNQYGAPYKDTIEFPSWTYPEELEGHKIRIVYHTQLVGDQCPINNAKTFWLNLPCEIEETSPKFHILNVMNSPFSSSIIVKYGIPYKESVSIDVYDVNGRLVKNLLKKRVSAGYYTIKWDGEDSSGKKVPAGIYIIKMKTEEISKICKIVFIK